MSVCPKTTCMPSNHKGQKRPLDHLALKLQMVVGCNWDFRYETWVFWKSSQMLLNTEPSLLLSVTPKTCLM